jgi:PAS domain S-box-containing protein
MLRLGSDGQIARPTLVEVDFQAALDILALNDVRFLTKWVAVAYLVATPIPILRFPLPLAFQLIVTQLLCAAALAIVGTATARGLLPRRHVRLALAAALVIPILTQLAQAYMAYVPDRIGTFGLHIVGTGLFCLSAGWLTALLTLATAGWGLLVWLAPPTGPALGQSLVPIGTALAIAVLARTSRAAAAAHVEQLRRRDQEHLKQAQANEAKFRGIMNRIHDVFFRTDVHGVIEMISPSVERYGYRVADLVGRNALPFYADPRERERLIGLLLARGQVTDHELHFLRQDGERVVATMNVAPLLDENGQLAGIEGLLHDITERKAEEARQREEARDAATLAYVGQELIASLDEPTLLARLCELTTKVFECDSSHTFLVGDNGVVIAAGHGHNPEEWESLRVLEIPPDMAAPLLGRLRSEGAVQTVLREPRESTTFPIPPGYGITTALYFPLRRRDEIVGFQSVAFRGRTTLLNERKGALARRIAHLASLALENARLIDALERANDFKTRFLANMSHELRTPLNVIMGYNQILLDHACGPLTAEQTAILERVQGNAGDLLDLVCATLELSREDTRQFPLEIQAVDVRALMDSLAEERRALAGSGGVDLHFHTTAKLPTLYSDPRKLRMVLKNLIDNALKFTERGRVSIQAQPRDGGVQFRVSDTGVGIRPEDMELIFEPFRQGVAPCGSLDGVGLGLYIVRSLVSAMKGTVEAESQVGRGSTFRVWLPWRVESEPKVGLGERLILGDAPHTPHQRTQ